MNAPTNPAVMSSRKRDGILREVAVQVGVCVRPIAQRVTDTVTGAVRIVTVPCGSTRAKQCPMCAERARQARYWQCREGWHLTDEPDPDDRDDGDDDGDQSDDLDAGGVDADVSTNRVVRSTRRREDVAEFPIRAQRSGTVGRSFTGRDGAVFTPLGKDVLNMSSGFLRTSQRQQSYSVPMRGSS